MSHDYKIIAGNYKRSDCEHRVIMESYLGRPLSYNEVIHHINGDKRDNRLENLQVMSREDHVQLHHKHGVVVHFPCRSCGVIVSRLWHRVRWQMRQGTNKFYCSNRCASANKVPPIYKGKNKDE